MRAQRRNLARELQLTDRPAFVLNGRPSSARIRYDFGEPLGPFLRIYDPSLADYGFDCYNRNPLIELSCFHQQPNHAERTLTANMLQRLDTQQPPLSNEQVAAYVMQDNLESARLGALVCGSYGRRLLANAASSLRRTFVAHNRLQQDVLAMLTPGSPLYQSWVAPYFERDPRGIAQVLVMLREFQTQHCHARYEAIIRCFEQTEQVEPDPLTEKTRTRQVLLGIVEDAAAAATRYPCARRSNLGTETDWVEAFEGLLHTAGGAAPRSPVIPLVLKNMLAAVCDDVETRFPNTTLGPALWTEQDQDIHPPVALSEVFIFMETTQKHVKLLAHLQAAELRTRRLRALDLAARRALHAHRIPPSLASLILQREGRLTDHGDAQPFD